jgi:hypothetical protein
MRWRGALVAESRCTMKRFLFLAPLVPLALLPFVAVDCTLVSTHSMPVQDAGVVPVTIEPPTLPTDLATTLNDVGEAHAQLCQPDDLHPNFPDDADMVTRSFCQDLKPGGVMATPHGLNDLLVQLGIDFKDPNGANGEGGNPAFALLAHSSALTARKISTITPTAFIFTPPPADGSVPKGQYAFLAFDPGEQFVETAVLDPSVNTVNFYVIFFTQACNSAPGGCTTTDLLTPNLVTGWLSTTVYEMTTALNDTIFDCHVCHQPINNNTSFLRMQEIEPPFTHWMSASTEGGKALLADFHAAHGTAEDYGGIPAAMIDKSDPSKLAAFINQAGMAQPNYFRSAEIEAEVAQSATGQPSVNVPTGTSAIWQAISQQAVAGNFIATPYHDVKVTDPLKLASASQAYQAWLGKTSSTLPDIRDVFLDEGLRDMGFAPKLGLDGKGLIAQMCQECHNSNLDMTLSREKFLADNLDQMSRAEKNLAIQRLGLDPSTRLRMPPPLFRTLTDYERELIALELEN